MTAASDIESCYRSEYRRIVGVVSVVTGSVPLAEEAVQEAFARALVRSRRGPPLAHLAAWIVTVALNQARSGRRSASSERRALERTVRSASRAPEDEVPGWALREAVAGLSGRQRDVVVLYYLLDLSVEAVAEALGVAQGTVKTALSRARTRLAELLDETELEA